MFETSSSLGTHILVEAYDCEPKKLDNLKGVQSAMVEAAELAGATVLDVAFRQFAPQGVSGVVIISESHLTIHTWPEFGYAAIDLFTCGTKADPWKAFKYITSYLKAKKVTTMELKRGSLPLELSEQRLNIDKIDSGLTKVEGRV